MVQAYIGSDWVGPPDRRSLSGGLLVLGSSVVSSWSRVQKSVALSSAEAEYMAIVMAYVEAKIVQAVVGELLQLDVPLQLRILTDS